MNRSGPPSDDRQRALPNEPLRRYPSRRDWWVVLLIWGAVGLAAWATWAVGREFRGEWASLLWLGFNAFVIGLLLWLYFGTWYVLTGTKLVARSGPFRWSVLYERIEDVHPTRNPLSSPALSLQRLWIGYRDQMLWFMVSPREQSKFLADLAARCPHLRREGDRLVLDPPER